MTTLSKQQQNTLIDGYIRRIQNSMNNKRFLFLQRKKKQNKRHIIIPTAINKICFKFYFCPMMIMDSTILTKKEKTTLWMLTRDHNISPKLKLLFRGSKHGFKCKHFHQKCDNKGKTLTIIQTDKNNVFGGYTSVPWTSFMNKIPDETAFLFLIRSNKNYEPQTFNIKKKQSFAVVHGSCYMVVFGSGWDLVGYGDCNTGHANYVKAESFEMPSLHYLNGDVQYFTIVDIETFSCE
eukprot:38483_1